MTLFHLLLTPAGTYKRRLGADSSQVVRLAAFIALDDAKSGIGGCTGSVYSTFQYFCDPGTVVLMTGLLIDAEVPSAMTPTIIDSLLGLKARNIITISLEIN